jgi:fatty acid desaturase
VTKLDDEFEGIDISGPWGGVRFGGRFRDDEDVEVRRIRQRVRRRLNFYRNVALYVAVVGALALLDWLTGGGWWVQWLAGIWGALIVLEGFSTFVSPLLWSREAEDRMVRRELERRRGRVKVTDPEHRDPKP